MHSGVQYTVYHCTVYPLELFGGCVEEARLSMMEEDKD